MKQILQKRQIKWNIEQFLIQAVYLNPNPLIVESSSVNVARLYPEFESSLNGHLEGRVNTGELLPCTTGRGVETERAKLSAVEPQIRSLLHWFDGDIPGMGRTGDGWEYTGGEWYNVCWDDPYVDPDEDRWELFILDGYAIDYNRWLEQK